MVTSEVFPLRLTYLIIILRELFLLVILHFHDLHLRLWILHISVDLPILEVRKMILLLVFFGRVIR